MQYAQRFFRPIQDLSEKYNILQSAMASGERVFKLLDTRPEITSPAAARTPDGPGSIEFEHVWFAYRTVPIPSDGPKPLTAENAEKREGTEQAKPGEPDWVLRDVSFVIEPGETVAIVEIGRAHV